MAVIDNVSFFTTMLYELSYNFSKVHGKLLKQYYSGYDSSFVYTGAKYSDVFNNYLRCMIKCTESFSTIEFTIGSKVHPLCIIRHNKSMSLEYSYTNGIKLNRSKGTDNDTVLKLMSAGTSELIQLPGSLDNDVLEPWEFQMLTKYDIGTFNIFLLDAWIVNELPFYTDIEVNFLPFGSDTTSAQRACLIEMFTSTVQGLIHEASKIY